MNLFNNQKIRFIVVGILNSIFSIAVFICIDFILTTYLSSRFAAYMSATIISTPIAMTQAFFTQKYLTFISDKTGKKMFEEFLKFIIISSWVVILRIILMPVFVEIFKMHPWIAAILINIIKAVFAYFGHSRYTFNT